ncbi:hypothetical protein B0F90DRAFT_324051 [Multifurca ochricompacta]|uniref:Uncharacterized protein n=1 Tax=Multifurca ochricompacta TaxID=376703 RepID=A0AAD4M4J3_9AGAM|nr:hypothetical protein B0F90DRAFT_324051 [Multifurca ochricompacta]
MVPSILDRHAGRLGLSLMVWQFFVRGGLYRYAPQNATPRYVRTMPFAFFFFGLNLTLALAAYETNWLTIPIMHEIKRDAAWQMERQRWRELNEPIAKIGREYVLVHTKMSTLFRESNEQKPRWEAVRDRLHVPQDQRCVHADATRCENKPADCRPFAALAAPFRAAQAFPNVCAPYVLSYLHDLMIKQRRARSPTSGSS